MNGSTRSSAVIVALVSALLIPRIQKSLGVTLTNDDIAALMALAVAAGHAIYSVLERYLTPPPHPTPPNPNPLELKP